MKSHLFFKIFAVILIALYQLPAMAQGVIIYQKDGTKTKYSYEEIDSIVTYIKEEDNPPAVETGSLNIDIKPILNYSNGTRAVNSSIYENKKNYTIKVFKDTTLIGTYLNTQPLELAPGYYTIKAFCGTEHAVSRDEILLYGEYNCGVYAGQCTNVTITCKPTSTLLAVEFDESLKTHFHEYNCSVEGIEALNGKSLTWSEENSEPWYVKVKNGGESVKCTFVAKLNTSNKTASHTFTLNLNSKEAYKIKIRGGGDEPSINISLYTGQFEDGDVNIGTRSTPSI